MIFLSTSQVHSSQAVDKIADVLQLADFFNYYLLFLTYCEVYIFGKKVQHYDIVKLLQYGAVSGSCLNVK